MAWQNGFAFMNDYYYSRDIRKTMFDNYVQYMKLEHSEQATYITRKLLEARKATYYTSEAPLTKKGQIAKADAKLYNVEDAKESDPISKSSDIVSRSDDIVSRSDDLDTGKMKKII